MAARVPPPSRKQSMRPPPRPSAVRTLSSAMALTGRISPAESTNSLSSSSTRQPHSPGHSAGTKRKERDFEDTGEETNINVVVRCRGRNDREVRENSGVVVSTDGVKGKTVELSMGASALSNKTYHFDKVFSPAADQSMIFEEVVAPMIDEVLAGFNCTIFAYGQTGTGKTYTMSGDITDTLPLPDAAGIVPRVLYSLFAKLESSEAETSVKCSFIELYNEELRDLLSIDETVKLKIFDDTNNKKGQTATLVQGMEECHIKNASKGIELLRSGSHKRQVAATKCNDLSSRSHTVFTITVYLRRSSETGEDFVSAGKLNLVDLAGSENIQRSGAENKRAAEAGLINKSLLTLGRVINALVDKSSHIPYRESKLTRLLQDSLGGRTKTCIIATLSPAKSNLEETISTLDYAFRAKNIRNKPQINQMVSKKTLLREFTAEIEKLKSELVATRSRNGVYLTTESYEEITTESESRRILSEEQKDKIETLEVNLRNKAQELFSLTSNFSILKKENEATKVALDGANSVLEKTEIVLAHTRQSFAEENMLRKAHQTTEEELQRMGRNLISTLKKSSSDVNGLHAKLHRKVELHAVNRNKWATSQVKVADTTSQVEQKITTFQQQHKDMIQVLSDRMESFVKDELAAVEQSKTFLEQKTQAFESSESEIHDQNGKAHDEMNLVLEEIKTLRDDVKKEVGEGLSGLSVAAQRISAGVIAELEGFHTQLHASYSALGKDFKNTFDELVKHLTSQQSEAETLHRQLADAGAALAKADEDASAKLTTVLAEEKQCAAHEQASLIAQISSLIQNQSHAQEKRLEDRVASLQAEITASRLNYQQQQELHDKALAGWSAKEVALVDELLKSRENVKTKIKKDWTAANDHNKSIQTTTRSIHDETIHIVDAQMKNLDVQLHVLDDILSRVRTQNGHHHEAHVQSLACLTNTVKKSYASLSSHLQGSSTRARSVQQDTASHATTMLRSLEPLSTNVNAPLTELRSNMQTTSLAEYTSTGSTPQKTQYHCPSVLPITESHEILLAKHRGGSLSIQGTEGRTSTTPLQSPVRSKPSPTKSLIFADDDATTTTPSETNETLATNSPLKPQSQKSSRPGSSAHTGLREIDVNVITSSSTTTTATAQQQVSDSNGKLSQPHEKQQQQQQPPLKRQNTGSWPVGRHPASGSAASSGVDIRDFAASVGAGSKLPKRAIADGRENVPFGTSLGTGNGRQLRSRAS